MSMITRQSLAPKLVSTGAGAADRLSHSSKSGCPCVKYVIWAAKF